MLHSAFEKLKLTQEAFIQVGNLIFLLKGLRKSSTGINQFMAQHQHIQARIRLT